MKRPALQNKQVAVLRMAFRARKVLGTFEKRAPGLLFGSSRSSLVQKCGFKLRHHDVLNVQSFAKSVLGRDFKGGDPGKKPFF